MNKKKIAVAIILASLIAIKIGSRIYRDVIVVGTASEFPPAPAFQKNAPEQLAPLPIPVGGESYHQDFELTSRIEAENIQNKEEKTQSFAALYQKQAALMKKVLLSDNEKLFLSTLANDPEYREQLFRQLKVKGSDRFSTQAEISRIEVIDLIAALVPLARQNSKAVFVELLLSEISNPLFKEIADKKLRKSVLGDKSDLIGMLRRFAPDDYKNFAQEVDTTNNKWLKYLIKYSENHS